MARGVDETDVIHDYNDDVMFMEMITITEIIIFHQSSLKCLSHFISISMLEHVLQDIEGVSSVLDGIIAQLQ